MSAQHTPGPWSQRITAAKCPASLDAGVLTLEDGSLLELAALIDAAGELMGCISDVLDDDAFDRIDTAKWNALSAAIAKATGSAS